MIPMKPNCGAERKGLADGVRHCPDGLFATML